MRAKFLPVCISSLGIYDEVVAAEELVGNAHRRLQVAAAIVLQVEYQVGCALQLQFHQRPHKLFVGGGTETADAYIAHARPDKIVGIERFDGYFIAFYMKGKQPLDAGAHDTQLNDAAFGASQSAYDVFLRHLHPSNGRVVNAYNAVASHYSHLF